MKQLTKLFNVCLALAIAGSSIALAQEERPERDGANRQRGEQGQGQGQRNRTQGRRGQAGGFQGAPGGGGFNKLTLVAAKPVQEELKLGEDELFFINKLVEEQRAEARELFSGIDFRSLSEEDRRAKFEELGKKRAELSKESEKGLSEFLTEAQSKRLDEIALQLKGIRALTDEAVGKQLKLTADQKKEVEAALASADADRRKMFEELRAAGGGFEGMREKMEAARKASEEKALAVLTAGQKGDFEALKGKPFQADPRTLFGFGGRGGQPRGNRNQNGQPGQSSGGNSDSDKDRPKRPAAE